VWSLCSLDATTLINKLGLPYGRKSQTISPPRGEFASRDYLRGVIDADGSVGYTGKGFPFVSLTTASTAIGHFLCDYGKQVSGVQRTIKRNERDGIYNILYATEARPRVWQRTCTTPAAFPCSASTPPPSHSPRGRGPPG
jgi:hypothetical protein